MRGLTLKSALVALLVCGEMVVLPTVFKRPAWIPPPPATTPSPYRQVPLTAILRDYVVLFGVDLPCALIEKVGAVCR